MLPGLASATVCEDAIPPDDTPTIGCGWDVEGVVGQWPSMTTAIDGYGCDPNPQIGREVSIPLECTATGEVTLDFRHPHTDEDFAPTWPQFLNSGCDLDVFVMDDTCDVMGSCLAANVEPSIPPNRDYVVGPFVCEPGRTYYVIVEFAVSSEPQSTIDLICRQYNLAGVVRRGERFEMSVSCDVAEDCDNGVDDDGDTDVDCEDSDCDTFPACQVPEDCDAVGDEDGNGLADCADPVCQVTAACCDVDGDLAWSDRGVCGGDDCDDDDPTIFPGADEVVGDDVDDDCDQLLDCWVDGDGDGFGDDGEGSPPTVTSPLDDCLGTGEASRRGDCDDVRADVNPDAVEGVADGFDADCDGVELCYADGDGDGYGVPTATTAAVSDDDLDCTDESGQSDRDDDCDDGRTDVHPEAEEIPWDGTDQDCVGGDLRDLDGDGHEAVQVGGDDCVDTDPGIHPLATELADGIDQDCDGVVDDGTLWGDDDDDGYSELGGDCADDDASRHPGATESINQLDDDCDGVADEGTTAFDDDLDAFSEADGDCNDHDPLIYPGAPEPMGVGVDRDCDGAISGQDGDGDGYAPPLDCDDADPSRHPGRAELENGIDDDCDDVVDDGTPAWDDDGDGASENEGDCDDSTGARGPHRSEDPGNGIDDDCDGLLDEGGDFYDDDRDGFTEDGGDCDDADDGANPAAVELPANGVDDDCDGEVDETGRDADGDLWTVDAGDCDDDNGWANPGREEICDGVDNDCDGRVDEELDACVDGLPARPVDEGGDDPTGCSTAPGAVGWLALLPLLGLRRRR